MSFNGVNINFALNHYNSSRLYLHSMPLYLALLHRKITQMFVVIISKLTSDHHDKRETYYYTRNATVIATHELFRPESCFLYYYLSSFSPFLNKTKTTKPFILLPARTNICPCYQSCKNVSHSFINNLNNLKTKINRLSPRGCQTVVSYYDSDTSYPLWCKLFTRILCVC